MKITSKFVFVFFIAFMHVGYAADKFPSDAPPQINDLTEDAPAVTKSQKQSTPQTTQTIKNGEQTEVKVTNDLGTYIVRPNQSVGNSLPGDAQSSSNHAVQWVIKSWGGNKSTVPTESTPELLPNSDNSENNVRSVPINVPNDAPNTNQ